VRVTLSPPLVPVFPAGYGPLPADFDTWVQDTFGFITAQVVFRAEQHTTQSLSSAAFTTITYDTILEDPYGGWSATSTSSQAAHSWLAPFTGWYEITLNHSISTVTTVTEAVPYISATTQWEMSEVSCTSSTEGGTGASLLVSMVGGSDYVQGQAWSSAAASIDVSAAGRYPWMEITFISQ
jgi:hypothetical protein